MTPCRLRALRFEPVMPQEVHEAQVIARRHANGFEQSLVAALAPRQPVRDHILHFAAVQLPVEKRTIDRVPERGLPPRHPVEP